MLPVPETLEPKRSPTCRRGEDWLYEPKCDC